jgi:hypothetical protein
MNSTKNRTRSDEPAPGVRDPRDNGFEGGGPSPLSRAVSSLVVAGAALLGSGTLLAADVAWIRPAGGLFVVGDEVRMYYCNASGPVPYSAVGMATWRRDGFVSLHAGESGGELLTRAFIPTGPELHLNLNASQGEATVRVCDLQGRPLKGWQIDQPSEPIRGDQLDAVVRWNRSDLDQRVTRLFQNLGRGGRLDAQCRLVSQDGPVTGVQRLAVERDRAPQSAERLSEEHSAFSRARTRAQLVSISVKLRERLPGSSRHPPGLFRILFRSGRPVGCDSRRNRSPGKRPAQL